MLLHADGRLLDMEKFIVYKHTCQNGKVYIGITKHTLQKRCSGGKSGYRHNKHFENAIEKYGWDNIKHDVIFEGLTKEEACAKEIELIALYKSNDRRYGYNNSIGGEHNRGFHLSEEAKRKVSEAQKGRKRTKEQIEKMRAYNLGRKASDETKKKLKGRTPWNKGKKGLQHHDEEWKIQASIRASQQNSRIKVKCVETGIVYESMQEAIRAVTSKSQGNLCRAIKLNHCFAGYHWTLA